jgi:hypothetical protein
LVSFKAQVRYHLFPEALLTMPTFLIPGDVLTPPPFPQVMCASVCHGHFVLACWALLCTAAPSDGELFEGGGWAPACVPAGPGPGM